LSEAPLDANGHFKDYDFVSGLVRFLPILVGTCAQAVMKHDETFTFMSDTL